MNVSLIISGAAATNTYLAADTNNVLQAIGTFVLVLIICQIVSTAIDRE
jgi:hypothetical protein